VFSSKFSAHKTPAEFVEWAVEKRGIRWYEVLKERKNKIVKFNDDDYEEIITRLAQESFNF
tara:strand:- start:8069 stop:8251 length:183 start_codon:yes stop_codon:yes gene_type:complete